MKITDFLTMTKDTLHVYNQMCAPILQKYDLPQVSFDILMFLTNNPQFSTAQEISVFRNIKKNLVSVHVDKLVNAGLLERSGVPGDRRKVALSCTEKATPIIQDGQKAQEAFFQCLTAGITPEEWAVFARVHGIMHENIKGMHGIKQKENQGGLNGE